MPPLQQIWKRTLLFRRGRTLAGPPIIDQLSPARQSQARRWNRTIFNFWKTRAQWPGGNLECHSVFARRKFCKIQQVRVPRNGVQGVSEYEREALILSSPPGASFASFWASRKKLAAGAAKSPAMNEAIRLSPPHPSGLRPATFPPGGRLEKDRR